jgi:hypothetical protein
MSITKKGYFTEYFILVFKLKFLNIVKKFRYRRIIAKGDSDVDGIENVCDSNPCYINVGIGSAAKEPTDTDCDGMADNDEPPTVIELSRFIAI